MEADLGAASRVEEIGDEVPDAGVQGGGRGLAGDDAESAAGAAAAEPEVDEDLDALRLDAVDNSPAPRAPRVQPVRRQMQALPPSGLATQDVDRTADALPDRRVELLDLFLQRLRLAQDRLLR